jgi:hypothetical protein
MYVCMFVCYNYLLNPLLLCLYTITYNLGRGAAVLRVRQGAQRGAHGGAGPEADRREVSGWCISVLVY